MDNSERIYQLSDESIKNMWEELSNIPFNEDEKGELILAENWKHFEVGTCRQEIWHWFDNEHSKGVAYLMGLIN